MFARFNRLLLASLYRGFSNDVRNSNPRFDVVIVGGGMTGFGLAALAACSDTLRDKKVLLLESGPKQNYRCRNEYETRVVALSCASQSMLQRLNAWDFIKSNRAEPVKVMKVWEDQSDAFLVFERDPLAYIVENNLVSEALRATAEHPTSPVTIEYEARVDRLDLPESNHPDQLARVHVRGAGDIQSRIVESHLVIGADGAQSQVRQLAGLKAVAWNHGQAAVVSTLCMGEGNEPFTAWQRFMPNGPIALLPLSTNHSSLVWSTTNEEAEYLLTLSDTDFVQALNHALSKPSAPTPLESEVLTQLGKLVVSAVDQWCEKEDRASATLSGPPTPPRVLQLQPGTKRAKFPLGFQHTNDYHAHRVALVGDAAHRILPLAGQGINLGFGDAMSLIHWMEEAISHGADLGNPIYLQQYTSDRQRANIPVAATMELLNLLYSTDAFAAKLAQTLGYDRSSPSALTSAVHNLYARVLTSVRSAGLSSVQSSRLIKNFLMDAAITGQLGVSPSDL